MSAADFCAGDTVLITDIDDLTFVLRSFSPTLDCIAPLTVEQVADHYAVIAQLENHAQLGEIAVLVLVDQGGDILLPVCAFDKVKMEVEEGEPDVTAKYQETPAQRPLRTDSTALLDMVRNLAAQCIQQAIRRYLSCREQIKLRKVLSSQKLVLHLAAATITNSLRRVMSRRRLHRHSPHGPSAGNSIAALSSAAAEEDKPTVASPEQSPASAKYIQVYDVVVDDLATGGWQDDDMAIYLRFDVSAQDPRCSSSVKLRAGRAHWPDAVAHVPTDVWAKATPLLLAVYAKQLVIEDRMMGCCQVPFDATQEPRFAGVLFDSTHWLRRRQRGRISFSVRGVDAAPADDRLHAALLATPCMEASEEEYIARHGAAQRVHDAMRALQGWEGTPASGADASPRASDVVVTDTANDSDPAAPPPVRLRSVRSRTSTHTLSTAKTVVTPTSAGGSRRTADNRSAASRRPTALSSAPTKYVFDYAYSMVFTRHVAQLRVRLEELVIVLDALEVDVDNDRIAQLADNGQMEEVVELSALFPTALAASISGVLQRFSVADKTLTEEQARLGVDNLHQLLRGDYANVRGLIFLACQPQRQASSQPPAQSRRPAGFDASAMQRILQCLRAETTDAVDGAGFLRWDEPQIQRQLRQKSSILKYRVLIYQQCLALLDAHWEKGLRPADLLVCSAKRPSFSAAPDQTKAEKQRVAPSSRRCHLVDAPALYEALQPLSRAYGWTLSLSALSALAQAVGGSACSKVDSSRITALSANDAMMCWVRIHSQRPQELWHAMQGCAPLLCHQSPQEPDTLLVKVPRSALTAATSHETPGHPAKQLMQRAMVEKQGFAVGMAVKVVPLTLLQRCCERFAWWERPEAAALREFADQRVDIVSIAELQSKGRVGVRRKDTNSCDALPFEALLPLQEQEKDEVIAERNTTKKPEEPTRKKLKRKTKRLLALLAAKRALPDAAPPGDADKLQSLTKKLRHRVEQLRAAERVASPPSTPTRPSQDAQKIGSEDVVAPDHKATEKEIVAEPVMRISVEIKALPSKKSVSSPALGKASPVRDAALSWLRPAPEAIATAEETKPSSATAQRKPMSVGRQSLSFDPTQATFVPGVSLPSPKKPAAKPVSPCPFRLCPAYKTPPKLASGAVHKATRGRSTWLMEFDATSAAYSAGMTIPPPETMPPPSPPPAAPQDDGSAARKRPSSAKATTVAKREPATPPAMSTVAARPTWPSRPRSAPASRRAAAPMAAAADLRLSRSGSDDQETTAWFLSPPHGRVGAKGQSHRRHESIAAEAERAQAAALDKQLQRTAKERRQQQQFIERQLQRLQRQTAHR